MGKIFYITGPSSSGKDTIYRKVLEHKELNLKTIEMHTTRPIRVGEVNGIEYHFVTEKELLEFYKNNSIIECRNYDTILGKWRYFTVNNEYINLKENNYLMIGVLDSFIKTRDYFGTDKVVPLFIQIDDGVRLQRALDRERSQEHPKYQELCRRYLADARDFSDENILAAGIDRKFCNIELETCTKEIIDFIQKEIL